MSDVILFTPQRGWTLNGAPLVGGKAIFLQSGTDTELTVYADAGLSSVLTQPVLADSNGVFPTPYFDGSSQVRVIVRDGADVELSDIDPVPTASLSPGGAQGVTFSATSELPFANVQAAIEGLFSTIEGRKTGESENYVSGAAWTANNLGKMNADGDLVDAGAAISADLVLTNDPNDIPTRAVVNTNVTALPFQKSFLSSAQTITTAGSLTIAHGLGAVPILVAAYLKCLTAEHGYSVGDEVIVAPSSEAWGSTINAGMSVVPDATNLNVRLGSYSTVFSILGKTTGTISPITPANWELYLRAWA